MKKKQRMSEQDVLGFCKAYIQEHGEAPGEAVFQRWASIRKHDYIGVYWSRHSDMVVAAGGQPKEFVEKIPDNELFSDYARVCLHIKKIPTPNELKVAERSLKTRTSKIGRGHGAKGKAEFLLKFRNWLVDESPQEYKIVLDFPGWETRSVAKQNAPVVLVPEPSSTLHKIHPFLPASLLDFSALARNESAGSALLFENRCADAFRALGFEVSNLGQGKGRGADSLALARRENYAVIVDAKAYADGFSLAAAEDRKLKEYAERHTEEVKRYQGIQHTYLCIVSSSFRQVDVVKFQTALAGSGINGFSLWTAKHLMDVVERSIKQRYEFSLKELERDFFVNSIVD